MWSVIVDAVQVWWCKASCSTVDAIVVLCIFSTLWKLCNSIHICGCKVFIVFLWISKFFVDCIPHMTKSIFSWAYQHTQRERERERVIFVPSPLRLLLLPFVPLLYVLSATRERERLHSSSACVRLLSHSSSLSPSACVLTSAGGATKS